MSIHDYVTKEDWDQYKDLEHYPDRVCKCGCGERIKVKLGHKYDGIPKYILGHNRRGKTSLRKGKTYEEYYGKEKAKEIKRKQKEFAEGRHSSEETKEKLRKANEGKVLSEESKVKQRVSMRKLWDDPNSVYNMKEYKESQIRSHNTVDYKESHRRIMEEKWKDPEFIEKMDKIHASEEFRLQQCEGSKKLWQNPEYIAKQIKASHAFPNKLEKFLEKLLQKLFPDQWKYVGSGDFIVEDTRRNPDFIHVSQKKIIEHFGDWWHGEEKTGIPNEQHEQERIDLFAQHGYKTLIIWEHELEDVITLKEKILKFNKIK